MLVLLRRDRHVHRPQILLEVLTRARARDREKIFTLEHDPRQHDLRRRTTLFLGQGLENADEVEVLGEILGLEARHLAAEVPGVEVVERFVLACQEAPAQGGVVDDGDAELAAGAEEVGAAVGFDVQGPGVVFDLDGGDGVDGVAAAEGVRGAFGEAEVFDLAFSVDEVSAVVRRASEVEKGGRVNGAHSLLELCHHLNGLLDRCDLVESVNVEEIDGVHTEVLEALLAAFTAVLRRAVDDHGDLAIGTEPTSQAELGGEEDILTTLRVQFEPLADESFVVAIPSGGVPETNASLPGMVHDLETLLISSE